MPRKDNGTKITKYEWKKRNKFDELEGGGGGGGAPGAGGAPQVDENLRILGQRELAYSVTGIVVGFLSIVAGVVLFFFGITGKMTFTTNVGGADSKLVDAAPGTVLFIVGLFIIFFTRFRVEVTNPRHQQSVAHTIQATLKMLAFWRKH